MSFLHLNIYAPYESPVCSFTLPDIFILKIILRNPIGNYIMFVWEKIPNHYKKTNPDDSEYYIYYSFQKMF